MSARASIGLSLTLMSSLSCICSVSGDMQSFKCFNNGQGRTPGFAGLMPAGQVTSLPDAWGISAFQCSSLCLKQNNSCVSFAFHDRLCFLRNISLAHPGLLCGISVLEGRLRCPKGRIGDVFIAFGGANRRMMECMCGVNNNATFEWSFLTTVSRYNCVDSCNTVPCFMKMGDTQQCWLCNGNYSYCKPFRDISPSYPQRLGCTPIG